ncbi:hypothetical protein CMI47_19060 [Candidatus Pacearchaeota archaeon]|nr:hypothetical protein [Candidatus Pacearchaeota archaeon]|tara:strand:- start:3560 stop:4414 length:855 start_codon:yes stop_codon:yes gene_type:complete
MLLPVAGCSNDFTMIDRAETHVIIDSFTQADRIDSLDVLVVLDTSCSMNDNFANVATGMDILRLDIESLTMNYQFGYITADSTRLGYLGPYSSSSSQIDMLMAPSLLPTSFYEEGFLAAYTFLTSQTGGEFSRPDADFLLFLISDEDEQSNISPDAFRSWMSAMFVDVDHDIVSITTVEDPDSLCSFWSDVGHKYIELASLYGKDEIDICGSDWSLWLSDSSFITKMKDSIVLSEDDPIVKSMVVYIERQITNDWVYIPETNTVSLGFTPDYGELVEVGYKISL